ncbi:glycosyltransferase family 39 protein [Candidatus Sumerlaeota bacterium]|nr:glycosyltransferase family 39 protein [Candidatus Sumerlaeota bacterium]
MNSTRFQLIRILLFIAFLTYGALFIYKTSVIVEGKRYFCLMDDAMISMTYARNFAHGNGLVWHPEGKKVEGYTNLLWASFMALLHLPPLDISQVSLGIQIAGLIFLFINLVIVMKICDKFVEKYSPTSLAALALTAFYLPLNNWGLQGMEASLLTLLLNLAVLATLTSLQYRESSLAAFILLGIGTLARLDMVVPYLAFLLFLLLLDTRNKNTVLIWSIIILFLSVGSQTIFRFFYYQDFLPNAYYLKMTGIPLKMRIIRGGIALLLFIWKFNWVLFFLPLLGLKHIRERKILLPFILILFQLIYSVYAGGDAWEWWGGANRFISVIMPLQFILLSLALFQVIDYAMNPAGKLNSPHPGLVNLVFGILILGALINSNAIRGPEALEEWLLLKPPLHVEDHREKIEEALLIRKITHPEARVAVAWGGIPIYFSERQGVDLLGRNDRKIAREPMREISSFHQFTPGYLKRDYAYSLGELKPDLVAELARSPEEAQPFLDEAYQPFITNRFHMYIRKDSPHINWEEAAKRQGEKSELKPVGQ